MKKQIILTALAVSTLTTSAFAANNLSNASGLDFGMVNDHTINIGNNNTISDIVGRANYSVVIGNMVNVSANKEIAPDEPIDLSNFGTAYTGDGVVAIGDYSGVDTENGTALGFQSNTIGRNSVAVGAFSQAAGDNVHATDPKYAGSDNVRGVFSIGNDHGAVNLYYNGADAYRPEYASNFTRQLQSVAAGGISAESTDAVNGSQLYYTNNRVTNNENHIAAAEAQITELSNKIDTIEPTVLGKANSYTDMQLGKVGSKAAALASLHPLAFDKHKKLQLAVGVGTYKGTKSAAMAAFYQPNEDTLVSLGTTVGGGDTMANLSATFKVGNGKKDVAQLSSDEKDKKIESLTNRLLEVESQYKDLAKEVQELKNK